jgi:hypothetical protein
VNHKRRHFLKMTGGAVMTAALSQHAESSSGRGPADLTKLWLWEASELVRTKKVSPMELTKACLAEIERINPTLNAFITVTSQQALVAARAAEAEIVKGRWRGRPQREAIQHIRTSGTNGAVRLRQKRFTHRAPDCRPAMGRNSSSASGLRI